MQYFRFLFILGTALVFHSCAVTIPVSDTTEPTFIFEITSGLPDGPVRLTSSDDYSSMTLNLLRNHIYRFRLTASDQGGLSHLQLQVDWPTNFSDLSPSDVSVTTTGESSRTLMWNGDRDNPRTGTVITGKISTIIYNQSYAVVSMHFNILAIDFGGSTSSFNRVFKGLNVGVVDDTQPLGLIRI